MRSVCHATAPRLISCLFGHTAHHLLSRVPSHFRPHHTTQPHLPSVAPLRSSPDDIVNPASNAMPGESGNGEVQPATLEAASLAVDAVLRIFKETRDLDGLLQHLPDEVIDLALAERKKGAQG